MFYYDTKDNKSKKIGAIAAILYVAIWVVLMLVVSFESVTSDAAEGILISFGDAEEGYGDISESGAESASASSDSDAQQDAQTQDMEEAPAISSSETPATNVVNTNNPSNVQQATEQQQVNQRALFPGSSTSNASSGNRPNSEGTQGSPDGAEGGSPTGSGGGAEGSGFELTGRSIIGSLPSPAYGSNKSGRVIVEIIVDNSGKVVNATYRARGSTTNDSDLVNAALNAARQSRFNTIQGDELQTGTITYNFKLK